MIGKVRLFGVAVVAMLSMSAVVASAAHAATGKFTAEAYPATITGTQVVVDHWTFAGGVRTVTCEDVTFHGTITASSDPMTLNPTYNKCHSQAGVLPATITMNGCDYTLFPQTVTSTTGTLQTTLDCPAGRDVEIHIYENAAKHAANQPLCQYTINAQGPIPAGEYHDEGSGAAEDVTWTTTETPAATVTKGSKILCGAAAGAAVPLHTQGTITLKAETEPSGQQLGFMVG
jgi:hypothetical protein